MVIFMVVRWSLFLTYVYLGFSCGIGKKSPDHQWCVLDNFDELSCYLSSLLEMEKCYQGLGEYVQVIRQGVSHHVSCHGIHFGQCNFFHVLFLCVNRVIFHDDYSYDEYGHMVLQIRLILLLDEVKELLPEEVQFLCIFICIEVLWPWYMSLKSFGFVSCYYCS